MDDVLTCASIAPSEPCSGRHNVSCVRTRWGAAVIFCGFREIEVNLDERLIPVKTAQGHDELGTRQRRLGPRHRTMLVLVDGVRTIQEVLKLSAQAGAPAYCLDELITMGLVVVPDAVPFRPALGQDQPAKGAISEDG